MRSKKSVKVALPILHVDEREYAILESMALDHFMTVTQLLTELITPSGDKSAKWMVIQIDDAAYKAFQAYYDNDDEHHSENMIERCVNMEGIKLAEELKRKQAGK